MRVIHYTKTTRGVTTGEQQGHIKVHHLRALMKELDKLGIPDSTRLQAVTGAPAGTNHYIRELSIIHTETLPEPFTIGHH